MVRTDPYDPDRKEVECPSCGERSTGAHPGTCPNCGSEVRNVAVPRE